LNHTVCGDEDDGVVKMKVQKENSRSPSFTPVEVGSDVFLPDSGSLRQTETEIAGSFIAPKDEKPPLVDNGDIPAGM